MYSRLFTFAVRSGATMALLCVVGCAGSEATYVPENPEPPPGAAAESDELGSSLAPSR